MHHCIVKLRLCGYALLHGRIALTEVRECFYGSDKVGADVVLFNCRPTKLFAKPCRRPSVPHHAHEDTTAGCPG